jgi:hypothetical protein
VWVQSGGRKRRGHYEELWYSQNEEVSYYKFIDFSLIVVQQGEYYANGHKVVTYWGRGYRKRETRVVGWGKVSKVRAYRRRM